MPTILQKNFNTVTQNHEKENLIAVWDQQSLKKTALENIPA